jgi:hypothetical protein
VIVDLTSAVRAVPRIHPDSGLLHLAGLSVSCGGCLGALVPSLATVQQHQQCVCWLMGAG